MSQEVQERRRQDIDRTQHIAFAAPEEHELEQTFRHSCPNQQGMQVVTERREADDTHSKDPSRI
jgi:hypothetical protein